MALLRIQLIDLQRRTQPDVSQPADPSSPLPGWHLLQQVEAVITAYDRMTGI